MKKKGFIATSVLYSFFLIFVMVMVANIAFDLKNMRISKSLKDDVRNKVEDDSGFINYSIKRKTYNVGEEISFAGEIWQVITNNPNDLILILKRSLTKEEILQGFKNIAATNNTYFNGCNDTNCKLRACLNGLPERAYCYHYSNVYQRYAWNPIESDTTYGRSLVNVAVETWFTYHDYIQIAFKKNKLLNMTILDGYFNNKTSYVRIPYVTEASTNHNWMNSVQFHLLGKPARAVYDSFICNGNRYEEVDSTTAALVRPVINVKKD